MARTSVVKNFDEGFLYAKPMADTGRIRTMFVTTTAGGRAEESGDASYSSGELIINPLRSIKMPIKLIIGTNSGVPVVLTFTENTPIFNAQQTSGLDTLPASYPILAQSLSHVMTFDSSANTITYSSGTYYEYDDVFAIGDTIQVVGTDDNDGTYTITNVTSTVISLSSLSGTNGAKTANVYHGSSGAVGQAFDVLEPQSFTAGNLISWAQTKSGAIQELNRAIRVKGVLDHRKEKVDHDRSLSIQELYLNMTTGIINLAEQDLVIKVDIQDDRAGLTTETHYYYGAYVHKPELNESGGDTDTDVTFDVEYERKFNLVG